MRSTSWFRRLAHVAVLGIIALVPTLAQAVDLLPDIIVRESDLYDHDIVTNIIPGHVHLRLSNGTPNIGDGKLYLYGLLPPVDDTTQIVMQRVFDDQGGYTDREAGLFIYHPTHSHIHFEGWAQYNLREILPDDSVGAIVAQGEKTSFCIADFAIYDNTLPNFNPSGEFFSCSGEVQGLSVGWYDVYSKNLPDQWIDITSIPDGTYWLESIADPDNHVLEKDETNNVARIKVVIGQPDPINPDAFEPNDSIAEVLARQEGGPMSPNLGPCGPQFVQPGLTIHDSGNDDYFRFYMNDVGGAGDFVRIEFAHNLGDLDLRILNAAGISVGVSQGITNSETVSLNGFPEGWYYAKAYGYNGSLNPSYTLTIDPSENAAPSVTVLTPPAGDTVLIHGVQTYTTTWTTSDPENDNTWVSVYVNTTPALDGNEVFLPTSVNTDGTIGMYVINSAYFSEATYWVYCAVTDGGTVTGGWSAGTVTFVEPDDADGDGVIDALDNCPNFPNPSQGTCGPQGDLNDDGLIDAIDLNVLIDYVFFGGATPTQDPECPASNRGDTDCNGLFDAVDLNVLIDYIFFGLPSMCDPCACASYPGTCP